MFKNKKIFDISINISKDAIYYPDDDYFKISKISDLNNNDICTTNKLEMSTHTGTHLDFPSHFIKNGKNIEDFHINHFFFKAIIITIENNEYIEKKNFINYNLSNIDAVLFKTKNSINGLVTDSKFTQNYIYLKEDAADYLVEKKIKLVGIDYLSIEKYNSNDYYIHNVLLKNNILILESINLKDIIENEYLLICLPLKIKNCEASPVRAVLIQEN